MKISVLIPCRNEEKSIGACVQSCLGQTRKPDEIIVVDHNSTDNSAKILKSFGKKIKVVNLCYPIGNKSYAQEHGLNFVTGDIFICTDGDTKLDRNFVKRIEIDFRDKKIAAVSGYVRSLKYNWLTICRAYDYVIGQNIHKLAQNSLDYMFVIPGAAGAFRTETFNKYIGFDHDTVTEDLDFTYKLHKRNLKIKFDRKAIVFTQDPANLNSYINQMRRWFGGGCQNLVKHLDERIVDDPRRTLELSLIYVDGLIFSSLIFILPLINLILALRLLFLYLLVVAILSVYAAYKEKRADLLAVPFFYSPLIYINSWIFLEQFFKEVIIRKRNLVWFHPERVTI
jgi:cellulose synthase/poly-beta-1,6-N-acetylglucosamine synthase-like glycosyltransferase